MKFTRREVNYIRDNIDSILTGAAASVWFSIAGDPFHGIFERSLSDDGAAAGPNKSTTFRAGCCFGSMHSHSCFYWHETNNNKIMDIAFERAYKEVERIRIRLSANRFIIIHVDSIQMRNILVNHKEPGKIYILLPLKYAPKIFETESNGDNPNNSKRTRLVPSRLTDLRITLTPSRI